MQKYAQIVEALESPKMELGQLKQVVNKGTRAQTAAPTCTKTSAANSSMKGNKNESEKPALALIPFSAKMGIGSAFTYGARKYGANNYKLGLEWTRLISAAERHIGAFTDGEDFDPESTLNHLYHAGASICMLIEFYEKGLGHDDRDVRVGRRTNVSALRSSTGDPVS